MEKFESNFNVNDEIFEIIYPEINTRDNSINSKSFKLQFISGSYSSSISRINLELRTLRNQLNVIESQIKIEEKKEWNRNDIPSFENSLFKLKIDKQRIRTDISLLEKKNIDVEKTFNSIEKMNFPIDLIHSLKNLFGEEIGLKLITSGILIPEINNRKRNSRMIMTQRISSLEKIFSFFKLKNLLNYKFELFSPLNDVENIEIDNLIPEINPDYLKFTNKNNFKFIEKVDVDLNAYEGIFIYDFFNSWSSYSVGSSGKLVRHRGGEGIDPSIKDHLESDLNELGSRIAKSNYQGKIFILSDFYSSKRVIELIKSGVIPGFFINSILTFNNTFEEEFLGADIELIILDRSEWSKIFLGSINNLTNNLQLVLENLICQKTSETDIKNGVLWDLNTYFSFKQLNKIHDYNEFGKKLVDFQTFKLSNLVKDFILYKPTDSEFSSSPNSLFLTYSNMLKTFTVFGEKVVGPVTSGHQYIVQLDLDETKVLSSYLNRYFLDPDLGGRLVGSNESRDSSSIVFQSSRDILDINIFIPPSIEIQKERVSLIEKGQKVFNITNKLTDTNVSLTDELESIIELKPQENTLEDWINLCPFPIATILWKYNATISNTEKREYLGFFFEGLSEMLVMLILSSFVQDEEYFKKYRGKWFNERKFFNWYETTSFGTWCTLYSKLSDFISKELVRNEVFIRNLLGNPSDEFLNMLKSDEIKNVLWDSNELRKNTKGHNFAISKDKEKELLSLWEDYLHKILPTIGNGFSNTFIVKPTLSSLSKNKFTFVVKLLLGHNLELKEGKIETEIIMDSDELYLYHKNQLKPIHVIPYIRYIESKNACYFYSKMVGKTYRFVSYHHGIDGELNEDNFESDLLERFVQLLPKDPNS